MSEKNGLDYTNLEFHPAARRYRMHNAQEFAELLASLLQFGCVPRSIKLLGGKIIDGRNRYLGLKAAGIPAEEKYFATVDWKPDEVVPRLKMLNAARRHLTPQEMEADREERIERVAEARQEGKSLRAIAEEEGVSHERVRQDLKEATVKGLTVESNSGTVTGRDGRQRTASPKPKAKKEKPRQEEVKDALGQVVPARLRDVFADARVPEQAERVRGWMRLVEYASACRELARYQGCYPYLRIEDVRRELESAHSAIRSAAELIEQNLPHAVCPGCKGSGKEDEGQCQTCRMGCGYVPKWRLEEIRLEEIVG